MKFKPWVGDRYTNSSLIGQRLLVLGESHYGDDSWGAEEFTQEVVRTWAIQKRHAFFTKVAKLVLDLPDERWVDDDLRETFWHSVAFYNYVQEYVGPWARHRPTDEMWEAAAVPFLDVLAELRPTAVLVLGSELWRRLPASDYIKPRSQHPMRVYRAPAGSSIAAEVRHPSAPGFTYQPWRPRVRALLRHGLKLEQNIDGGA